MTVYNTKEVLITLKEVIPEICMAHIADPEERIERIERIKNIDNVIDLFMVMGDELFTPLSEAVQNVATGNPFITYPAHFQLIQDFLPFAKKLALDKTDQEINFTFALNQLKTKFSEKINTTELAQQFKLFLVIKYITRYFLFGRFSYSDDYSHLSELAKIVPNSFARISQTSFTVDDISLLAASFLPEDKDITVKILQLANPAYQSIESLRSSKALADLRQVFGEEKSTIWFDRSEFSRLWRSLNDKLDDIRYFLQKELKTDSTRYNQLLNEFILIVNDLKNASDPLQLDPKLFQALIDETASLIDRKNIHGLPIPPALEFYNYTKIFRGNMRGFLRNYLQLYLQQCIAPNKSESLVYEEAKPVVQETQLFREFIDKVHYTDKHIFNYAITNPLETKSLAFPKELFSNFEKLLDPQYHHLTKSEIAFNYLKIAAWFAINILAVAIVALVVINLPHLALVATLLTAAFVAAILLLSVLSMPVLVDNSFSKLSDNEKSDTREIFKINYYDKVDTFFSSQEKNHSAIRSSQNDRGDIPYTAVSRETPTQL